MADSSGSNRFHGYTMLELLIVLAIIGFMVTLVMPRIGSGFQGARLRSSVKQFASALRASRAIAVSQKALVVLRVSLGGREYRCDIKGVSGSGRAEKETVVRKDMPEESASEENASPRTGFHSEILGTTRYLEEGIVFLDFLVEEGVEIPPEGAKVLFYPMGNSSGGAFVIGVEDGPKYIVTIDRITGLVRFEPGE